MKRRMLDLFCGRGGWTNAFLDRGWEVTGVDLERHPDYRGEFTQADVLSMKAEDLKRFEFVCASSPCEEFSKFNIPCFYPDPPYPALGMKLFNHTREICWTAGIPHVMENVWGAQKFVGIAEHHSGPFYLWGKAVPPLMPQGIKKGGRFGTGGWQNTGSKNKKHNAMMAATIPPELANCVAEYAERLLEMKETDTALKG